MNYGLAEISTEDQAQDAWESFFGRFYTPEIPLGVDVTFNPDLRQFTPRNTDSIPKPFQSIEEKTEEAPLEEEKKLHSDDFDDFLNGNTVIIPQHIILNEKGLENVERAIKWGDYKNKVLREKDHTFYALWLFKQNKITRQQMTTVLARAQIPQEYPLMEIFPIFDSLGKFTKEALALWLPAVKSNWYGNKLTQEELDRLKLLISTAPKSEQIFFISKANPKIISPGRKELGNILQQNNAWYQIKYNSEVCDLHFSFGVIDAIQIAKNGIHGAAASRAKLGKVGIDTVKKGVEFYYRPTAISMSNSGVEANTKGIHGWPETPMSVVTAHDVFHSKLHNTIPPEFHMMLHHMNQIISKHTKQKWSKTIWEFVDREFHAFQYQTIDLDSKNSAKLFIKLLHDERYSVYAKTLLFKVKINSSGVGVAKSPLELNEDGFALVWNMVNQSNIWKELYKLDIDRLGFPYSGFIKKMKIFKEEVGEPKHSEILTLKYHFFNATSNQVEFKKICRLLDSIGEELMTNPDQKVVFGKHTVKTNKALTTHEFKNLTALKFKSAGQVDMIIDDSSVKQLFPKLINMHLVSIFGKKDGAAVETELVKISAEFKSTHHESKLSHAMLDASIKLLPSITAKLDFLETCYERIIASKGYTKRHAFADNLFSFFKNPLTTSQRKHIILLKEKLDEIVTQYERDNNLKQENSTDLQWHMKNRGSNLYLCNTKRFYLHVDSTVPSSAPM